MERIGLARHRAPRRDRRRDGGADRRARGRDLRARRARVHDRLARSSSPTVFFDELGLTKKRRGKTGFSTDARVLGQLRDEHPIVEEVERWRELTKLKNTYLDSLPEPGRRGQPHPHDLQPGDRGDRAAVEHQPEPPEHPDPLRGRPPGARLLRRRAGQAPALLRLQPGRAAGARPRRRRGRPARDLRLAARTSTRRPPPGSSAPTPTRSRPAERSKAKMVNYGIAYGLSGFRARRPAQHRARGGRRPTSTATSSASRGEAFIDETIAAAARGGLRRRR